MMFPTSFKALEFEVSFDLVKLQHHKKVFLREFHITHEHPPFSKFPLPIRTIFINNFLSSCAESNLNGVYCDEPLGNNYHGIFWEHWLGDYSLKASKMMVRPKDVWFSNPDDDLIELGNKLGGH